jgi:hypothetical protein
MTDLRHASPYDQGVSAGRRGGNPTNLYNGRTKEGASGKRDTTLAVSILKWTRE